MTDAQHTLLLRLRKRPVVFTGAETDEDRLAMLQLYDLGYVVQFTNRTKDDAMEWHITDAGRKTLGQST